MLLKKVLDFLVEIMTIWRDVSVVKVLVVLVED